MDFLNYHAHMLTSVETFVYEEKSYSKHTN